MNTSADAGAEVRQDHSVVEPGVRRKDAKHSLPILASVYTSQLSLGGLDAVVHPSFALGVEIPRASWGMWSIFPVWRAAYEHHTDFQQRITVGAVPTVRIDPHPLLAAQFGLEVGGAYLRSLWTPYRFDAESGTWSRGESEMKLTWQLGADLTAWVNVAPALGVGVFYGITLLYPLAPENEVSIVPLTKLGLCMRWNYGA